MCTPAENPGSASGWNTFCSTSAGSRFRPATAATQTASHECSDTSRRHAAGRRDVSEHSWLAVCVAAVAGRKRDPADVEQKVFQPLALPGFSAGVHMTSFALDEIVRALNRHLLVAGDVAGVLAAPGHRRGVQPH